MVKGSFKNPSPFVFKMAVPIPFSVKNSSNRQCFTRPSNTWTLETPFSIASIQFVSFGSIPPPTTPFSMNAFASCTSISEINVFRSVGSINTPSISVRNTNFSAEIAFAIAHAASSALIL